MARRISPSQFRQMMRDAQRKQQQAIDNYNRAVRQYNQKNRQIIQKYNEQVRAHNSRVRAHRQRVQNELLKLNRRSRSTHYVAFHTSVEALHGTYERLEQRAEVAKLDSRYDHVLDLSEREAANSLEVMNALEGDQAESHREEDPQDAVLSKNLETISSDLKMRWEGALFSLNPRNPDAARHFCTSAREILTSILALKAPDTDVVSEFPNCDTYEGKPTRRSKIKFLLRKKGLTEETLEEFVEQDIENVIQLFQVFNDGTHGSAGTFDIHKLTSIKKRVQGGIAFLTEIAASSNA